MSKINAKYPGVCKACGGAFPAGALIEWVKGSGSKHDVCPKVPVAPVAKPSAEDAPIVLIQKCTGKPGLDDQIGHTFRVGKRGGQHAAKIVTVVSQRRHYTSAEDADDFGDCDGGGWSVTLNCREATEAESVSVHQAEAKKAEAEAAKKLAVDAALAETVAVNALLATLEAHTETFDESIFAGLSSVLVYSRKDGGETVLVTSYTLASGEVVYVRRAYWYDSDRLSLYASKATIEAGWKSLYVADAKPSTREEAQAWLARYEGCAGSDYQRWIADGAGGILAS